MNSHTGEGALRMDSENVGEGCAGWILRVLIDEEWEEGGFPSRAEAEAHYQGLVKDYGLRVGGVELIGPSGDTEELNYLGPRHTRE
jgi:hypothetical protein